MRSIKDSLSLFESSLSTIRTVLSNQLSSSGGVPSKLKLSEVANTIRKIQTVKYGSLRVTVNNREYFGGNYYVTVHARKNSTSGEIVKTVSYGTGQSSFLFSNLPINETYYITLEFPPDKSHAKGTFSPNHVFLNTEGTQALTVSVNISSAYGEYVDNPGMIPFYTDQPLEVQQQKYLMKVNKNEKY